MKKEEDEEEEEEEEEEWKDEAAEKKGENLLRWECGGRSWASRHAHTTDGSR